MVPLRRFSLAGGIASLTRRDPGNSMLPFTDQPASLGMIVTWGRLKTSIPPTLRFPDCLPGYDHEYLA